ncbi:MAG: hypothetical protein ACOCX3_03890, partial [Chloroflexota bacterium]
MTTARDRIRSLLNRQEPDRIGLWDAYWDDTIIRWRSEGLPADTTPQALLDFDFELLFMDASLRLPERLLEDNPEYTIREDKHGFVGKQWKGRGGALGYISHAVNNRADWERLRGRLDVDFGGTARIGPISYFEPFVDYPTWDELTTIYTAMRSRDKFV